MDCVTSALLWCGHGYLFYLASAYGIGIFTWKNRSKTLPEIVLNCEG